MAHLLFSRVWQNLELPDKKSHLVMHCISWQYNCAALKIDWFKNKLLLWVIECDAENSARVQILQSRIFRLATYRCHRMAHLAECFCMSPAVCCRQSSLLKVLKNSADYSGFCTVCLAVWFSAYIYWCILIISWLVFEIEIFMRVYRTSI